MRTAVQVRGVFLRIGLVSLLVCGAVDGLGAQGIDLAPTKSVRTESTIVVAEQTSPIPQSHMEEALRIVNVRRMDLPGFPPGTLDSLQIVVSFASSPVPGRDAWISVQSGLIVLPGTQSLQWSRKRLERVIAHELAHLALAATVPNSDSLPLWLREGLAEWSAGGLTCEGEARIRLAFDRGSSAEQLAILDPAAAADILHYDMFGLFLAHADRRAGGAISDGSFVEALNAVDVNAAFVQITGTGVDSLQDEWRHKVELDFRNGLKGLSCRGSA